MGKSKERVLRFSASARFAHWGHTVTFLFLLFTGLALFSPGLGKPWPQYLAVMSLQA